MSEATPERQWWQRQASKSKTNFYLGSKYKKSDLYDIPVYLENEDSTG